MRKNAFNDFFRDDKKFSRRAPTRVRNEIDLKIDFRKFSHARFKKFSLS